MSERSLEDSKKLLLSVLLLGMVLFSLTSVSAFLDTKSFNDDVGKYGEIRFNDYWFINKADYRLTNYGASVINVYAEGEYTLYRKTHLFTGIFYKDIMGTKGNLKNVNFYIWNEEFETRYNPIYENQNCYNDTNLTDEEISLYPEMINEYGIERCDRVLISNESYEVDVSGWIPYEKGMDIDKGEGRWRMEAERPKNAKIDFILEAHDEEFIEWAWFNESWLYKREIGNLTGNFSFMEINKTEHMLPNYGDVRFVDTDGNIEMNYTIESYLDGEGYVYDSSNSPYDNGLVSYYKLDESSGTIVDTHGSNDGTYNGALYSQSGKINTAIGFDGTDDTISKTDMGISLGERNSSSVSMWINPDVVVGADYIFALGDAVNPSRGLNINSDSKISYRPSADAQVAFDATVSIGNWYHIVLTYDGTNVKGYQDGVLRMETTDTNSIATNPNLILGWFDNAYQFNGTIDEVAIFNRSLSQSEVLSLYNASYAQFRVHNLGDSEIDMYYGNADVTTTGSASDTYFEPVSYWYLDEIAGTAADDELDNFEGTANDARVFTTEAAGIINTGADFTAGADYIDLGDIDLVGDTDNMSISLWFKTSSTATDMLIGKDATNRQYRMFIAGGNALHFNYGTGAVGLLWSGNVASNDWIHVVASCVANGVCKLYINGSEVDSDTITGGGEDDGANCLIGERLSSSLAFDGYVDEVIIHNKPLTPDQVYQLYTQNEPVYILGAEESPNTAPTITANITKPDVVHADTDYLVNLTIEDIDVGNTLTGYAQFHVNGTAVDIEQSQVVVNGTTTLIATLGSGNFSGGDIIIAQVWAGDGTVNTTKVNLTSSTIIHSPSVTTLTEYPSDPTTYSQSTIYQFNATVTDTGTLDDIFLEFNGTNYTATNSSADIFNVSFTNLSVGTYNYRWFANNSVGGINNTEVGDFTVDKAIPEGSLTSSLGWIINETQEVTIGLSESQGGDDDVTYIVSRDNVAKGTGETWSPAYGTYTYVLNTTGGVNWTFNVSMDTQTLTVNDNINPNIVIDYPVNGSGYNTIVTELNYTASDTNLNTCWYSLNGGLANTTITCGDDITGLNSGEGTITWQMWANDSDNNVNTTTTTFFVDTISPLVTNLVEYPSDPQAYSLGIIYQFNATITDGSSTLDDIFLEFNGLNYTATNVSADIFNVSVTDLSAGIYNYRWFANDTSGNINNSAIGSYTINKATSQTSLTFDVPSPQTYETAITPTCSLTIGDGPVVLEMDGNVITSGSPITLGANTYSFNCSYAEGTNYTGSDNISSYTIDKAIPTASLTSNLGWNINEGQEVIIGSSDPQSNDGDVLYEVFRDGVSKGTGETWYPAYGSYTYFLNTTGGANWTANASMHTQVLTVNDDINPNIEIIFPVNNSEYGLIITELNYTVNDTNLNTCWYSLNGGLANTTITCGDNVSGLDSGQGTSTWQIWANDSDNNINTTTVTFTVDTHGPNVTILTEYPSDPATYSQETIYQFNATVIDSSTLDDIFLEFNGTNYSTSNAGNIFYANLNNLSTGVYNYRWFANDTLGNINNTAVGDFTVNKATPSLTLTATTPITYGTITDFSGGGCPAQLSCSLDIANNVYAAGTITGNYSTAGNVNYTSAYANFTVTINKATLTGSITGTSPINYTNVANITANETNNNDSDVVYILYRNNVTVSNPDNTILGAGNYFYHYNSTGGANYTSNAEIVNFTLTIDKATGEVYAYVSNQRANYAGNNLTAKNEYLNGSLNIGLGDINMYLNNSLINSGAPPLFNITDFPLGSYYFNVTYDGNDNYTSAEEHWGINISVWFLSNLTGVFNLNTGTGDIAYDISGNNNNGTIDGATWVNDNIDITLIDGFHYTINTYNGVFILVDDALDKTWVTATYTYFEYGDDTLQFIVTKLLPGLLIMLILIMIIRLFMGRSEEQPEVYVYEY